MEPSKNGTSEDPQQKKTISRYGKSFTPNQLILTTVKWAYSGGVQCNLDD